MKIVTSLALIFLAIKSRNLKASHSPKSTRAKRTSTQTRGADQSYTVEEGIWGTWLPKVSGAPNSYLCGFSYTEDNSVELAWIGMDGLKP
jgi:hypothetical protein